MTNTCIRVWRRLFSLAGLALLVLRPLPARADAVVTNCSPTALAAALAGGGNVTFTQACPNLILDSAITISTSVSLTNASGGAVIISGNNSNRLFVVQPNVTFTLNGLTLAQGKAASGGAIYIHPGAIVRATNCVFAGNNAAGSDGVAGTSGVTSGNGFEGAGGNGGNGANSWGGAICNLGYLGLSTCQFLTNNALGGNGGNGGKGGDGGRGLYLSGDGGRGGDGGSAYGGAICNTGTVFLVDCNFAGNKAAGGSGGIRGTNGTGSFPGLMGIGGAGAIGAGSGLCSLYGATVVNSTFSDNVVRGGDSAAGGTQPNGNGTVGPSGANAVGGGICGIGVSIAVTNCTFFNNRAVGGKGGDGGPADGFYGGDGGNGGNGWGGGLYSSVLANLVNCTFSQNGATGGVYGVAGSGNWAGANGSVGGNFGGNIVKNGGTFTLKNSIVAASLSGGNGFGSIADAGYNISSDSSIALGATSYNNTDPKVGSLAANPWSGNTNPVPTMALLAGSPALDKIPASSSPATDQRGIPRPVNSLSDIGAYEYQLEAPPVVALPATNQGVTPFSAENPTVAAAGGTPASLATKAGTTATSSVTPLLLAAQTPPGPPPPSMPPAPAARALPRPVGSSSATGQVATPFPAAPPQPAAPPPGPATLGLPNPGSASMGTNVTRAISPSLGIGPMAGAMDDMPTNSFNFPSIDINQFLTFYAELIGRTILRPAALPAPAITLKTQAPLTRKEALQAFDTLLAMNGITIIKIGDKFAKAVPAASAFQEGAPFSQMDPDALPETGQYDVHLVQLKYTKPSEMVPVLTPFAKIPNSVLAIDSSQILVIRDYAENVRRMLEIIKQIDITVPADFISEVIPIKYALASEISSALNGLGGGGGTTSVGRSAGGTSGTSTGARSTTGRPTTPGYPGGGGMPGMPGSMGSTSPFGSTGALGTSPAGGSSFTDRLKSIMQKATASGELQIIGQTKIIADERTNSLLIFATRQDMAMIKEIIEKLDVVLSQVIIEALIMEVSMGGAFDLGLSYVGKPKQIGDYFTGVGAIKNTGLLNEGNFISSGSSGDTNATGGVLNGLSYFARFGQDFDATLSAVATDSRVNVLSRPRIQTSHAVPATIEIGVSRPIITGTYNYYGGSPQSQYQYQNFGITLNVTPLINPEGLVVMDIEQQIQSVGKEIKVDATVTMPEITTRSANAKVAVMNRETVILGGFISTQVNDGRSGVPILMDLPLLGPLFRRVTKSNDRSELIVLIRPTVLETPDIAARVAKEEQDRLPGIRRAAREYLAEEEKLLSKEVKYEEATAQSNAVAEAIEQSGAASEAARKAEEQRTAAEKAQAKELDQAQRKAEVEAQKESRAAAEAARKAEEQRMAAEKAQAKELEQARKKAEAEAQKESRAAAEAARKAEEQRMAAEKTRARAEAGQPQKKAKPDWELFNQVKPMTPEERKALEAGDAPPP